MKEESNASNVDLNFQLFLDIEVVVIAAGEPFELHFFLYDAQLKEISHEPYVLKLSREGFPTNQELINNTKAVFKVNYYVCPFSNLKECSRI